MFSLGKFSQGNQSALFSNLQSQFSHRSSAFGRASQAGGLLSHSSLMGGGSGAGGTGAGGSTAMNLIDTLFAEKVDIYGKIYPENRNGVLHAIMKIILKTFIEIARLRTFNRGGLQQVQVDVEYVRVHFWRFVMDEKQVHAFLDETLQSALGRCVDPLLMEPSVVEKILSTSAAD